MLCNYNTQNMNESNDTIENLNVKIKVLEETVLKLQNQLKKYTNNDRHKRYYQKNKEKVKENAKLYLNKLKDENPEKIKEYRRRAYQKKKDKQQLCEIIE